MCILNRDQFMQYVLYKQWRKNKLLYFEWSPSWHFKSYILTYILTFYLTFYLTSILIFYLAYLPAFYLVYMLAFYLAYILAFYVAFVLAYIMAFYVAYFLAVYLAYILAFFLAYILAFHLAAVVQLGCGPAVPTQIGSRQLRSSSAHCARKLAKRLAKSWQGGSGRGSWCRHGRGETGGGGRGGGGGGEGGGGGRTALIKSNNPHLAGGEFGNCTCKMILHIESHSSM